jgi:hypothetical protein
VWRNRLDIGRGALGALRSWRGWLLVVSLGLCCLLPELHAGQSHAVAVAVSPKNTASNITLAELRKIFLGEKRTWPDGARVKLFSRSPGTVERTALLKLLGKSESDSKQY